MPEPVEAVPVEPVEPVEPIVADPVEPPQPVPAPAPVAATAPEFEGRSLEALRIRYLGAGYRRLPPEGRVVHQAFDVLVWACKGNSPELCVDLALELGRVRPGAEVYGATFRTLLEACEASVPGTCSASLAFHPSRSTRDFDPPTPAERIELGCSDGRVETCAAHGRKHASPEREQIWTQGCDGGDGASCAALARAVGKLEPVLAAKLLVQACERGHGPTCWVSYRREGKPTRPARGSEPYLELVRICDILGGRACERIAKVNLDGRRRDQDPVEALDRFEQACDAGRAGACRQAGRMHRRGRGTEPNRAKSRYYRIERGDPRAPYRFTAQIGSPNLLAVRAEAVLPLPIGPAIAVAGTFGGMPTPGASASWIRTLGAGARLYPRNAGRGFFLGGGVTDFAWTAKPGSLGHASEAGAPTAPRDDQSWGRPNTRAGAFAPGFTFGSLTQRGRFVFGLEFGVNVITSKRTLDLLPTLTFVDIRVPPVLPTINLQIGTSIR